MLLSHFNRELDKTAIIFEFLGKSFRSLEKLCLDRTFPLSYSTLYGTCTCTYCQLCYNIILLYMYTSNYFYFEMVHSVEIMQLEIELQ